MNVMVYVGSGGDDGDDCGLAAAVAIARGVVAASGPGRVVAAGSRGHPGPVLVRTALALGADRAVVLGGVDAATSPRHDTDTLATLIRRVSPDLVVTAAAIPVAEGGELSGLRCLVDVVDVAVVQGGLRACAGSGAGVTEVDCPLPALMRLAPTAAARLSLPRRPLFAHLMAARSKPAEHLEPEDPVREPRQAEPADPAVAAGARRAPLTIHGEDDGHRAVVTLLEELKVVRRTPAPAPVPPLEHADVVVAGGRGLGDAAGFDMVEELARLLHGAPAASGGAVAAGWAPRSWLVGQTGRRVRPHLYLSFGISGASQHLAGLKRAALIAAVNAGAGSPIFAAADLAVVADARLVLSRLLRTLS